MQRWSASLILFLGTLFICAGCSRTIAPPQKAELDVAYDAFIAALDQQDAHAFRDAVSTATYADAHNSYASMGKRLGPDHFKSMSEFMPKLDEYEAEELAHAGPTAGILYQKELPDAENDKTYVEFVAVKFVNEGNGWVFHGITSHTEEKVRSDGTPVTFDCSKLEPRMQVDGKIAPTPELRDPVEVPGYCQILTYGYRTDVTINGNPQGPFTGGSIVNIIDGGLTRGANHIEVRFTRINNDESHLDPNIIIKVPDAEGRLRDMVEIAPKGRDLEKPHTRTFLVEYDAT